MQKKRIIIATILSIITILIIPNIINANTNNVEYRGEAEGLIITTDDFFADFGELMPGDKKEGKALIKNTTKDKIEVFFKTELLPQDENYDEIDNSLLQKIKLKINLKNKKEEKNIYDGNLGAESISEEYISIGSYDKGFDGEFNFEIEIPKELKNAYSLSKTKVKWIFYVEKKGNIDNAGTNTNKNDNNTTDSNNNLNNNSDSNNNINNNSNSNNDKNNNFMDNAIGNVKTGDNIYYMMLIIIFIIICNTVFAIRRVTKDEKK